MLGSMSSRLGTLAIAFVTGGFVLAVAWLAPARIIAVAELSTCYWGDPVVVFDDDSVPVARWPDGLSWDWGREAVIDSAGATHVRKGDRLAIEGRIVAVHGDPSPCFESRGIQIDRIGPAAP